MADNLSSRANLGRLSISECLSTCILRVTPVAIATFSIVCAAVSVGFIQATLEPHMRQFDLSPLMMGKYETNVIALFFQRDYPS